MGGYTRQISQELYVLCNRRDSAFSFHTSPPSKYSFFQMGALALISSIAQWQACDGPGR